MKRYFGLTGLPGLDTDPTQHFFQYSGKYPNVGIKFGDMGHDAAAAVVEPGRVIYAVEEERLTRIKHIMDLPRLSLAQCRVAAGMSADKPLDVSFYLNPTNEHLARRKASCVGLLDDTHLKAAEAEFTETRGRVETHLGPFPGIHYVDHHLAHAASSFYLSGFDRSLVAVVDGEGESASISIYLGEGSSLKPLADYPVASSLGVLYAFVTAFLGFQSVEDEYKVMGLAAFGTTEDYRDFFDKLFEYRPDGTFTIPSLLKPPMTRLREWVRRLGPPRQPDTKIEDRHLAIAFSLQKAVERAFMKILETQEKIHQTRHLCMSGGVALNCAMNGVIDRTEMFDEIFVQPAASDQGTSLGAALVSCLQENPNKPFGRLEHVFLGPSYDDQEVRKALESFSKEIFWSKPADYLDTVTNYLQQGYVFGWFQGAMEFGPRALGNRSIIADPRKEGMRDRVNRRVKKREEFRPFAPSVIKEAADEYFKLRKHAQYEFMNFAVNTHPKAAKAVPAVVHTNGTARVHIVRKDVNPGFWNLLKRFGDKTGVPILLNTSFNLAGEPIVCSPTDAIKCFLRSNLDLLALQGYVVSKHPEGEIHMLSSDLDKVDG